MVKKLASHSVVAPQEKAGIQIHGSSGGNQQIPWQYLALGLAFLAFGLIAYTMFLLQGVTQWADFPVYLSPNSSIADDVYSSKVLASNDAPTDAGFAPSAASPLRGAENSNGTATQPPRENSGNNMNAQDDTLANSPAAAPPAASAPLSEGDNLPSTTATRESLGDQAQGRVDNATTTTSNSGKFSVLVGVFIMAYEMKRRDIIRLACKAQAESEDADFTVRFILGGYQLETWLEGENATHGDMIVLQCTENLNEGKTFTFFSSLPDMGLHFDYVMKTDDDSYVRLGNLGHHLRSFPRTDLYYGYSLPCDSDGPPADFRVGAGYIMSWDLVLWIRDSPIPRNETIGAEDYLVGNWFHEGGVARNRPSSLHLFHDHPDVEGPCAKPLSEESILVHRLKTDERWYDVIEFYNTTTNINN